MKKDDAYCSSPLLEGCPKGGVGLTPVGLTPVGLTPVGLTPVGSTPVGSTPVGLTPVGLTPVGLTPVGSTPVAVEEVSVLPHHISINGVEIQSRAVHGLPAEYRLRSYAKNLRKAGNLPEIVFWMQVHKRKFHKIDFDRQRVIGRYIVDFYVKKLGLVIEIDGSSHDHKKEYDRIREDYLVSLGLKVFRISVGDVMKNLDFAMRKLEDFIILSYSPPPEGCPQSGRGGKS